MGEELQKLQKRFATANLSEKLAIAHNASLLHSRFQHYVSLDKMLKMIENHEMWLTRSDSLTLDDWNECKKFGKRLLHRRTYIGCFSYHPGESAAMWGLYGTYDANQVKVSIPREEMKKWIKYLKETKDKIFAAECMHGVVVEEKRPIDIRSVEFSDVLYASVKGNQKGEKSRDKRIRWMGVISENKFDKVDVANPLCVARMKDVEWDFEEESRLIVTVGKKKDYMAVRRIKVPLTDNMIASMAFTLSPWVPEQEVPDYREIIRSAVRKSVDVKLLGDRRPYVYPSTLCGALGKWAKNRGGK